METSSSKKFLSIAVVFFVLAILSLLYTLEGFTSYQTNKEVWEGNMNAYEEYAANGDTVNAEQQMAYSLEAYERVNERKTQMAIGGVSFLLSLGVATFAYRKRN